MAGPERDTCSAAMQRTPDRGAYDSMTFNRCARGFTLSATGGYDRVSSGPHFAFDKVEDVAKWLVEQYGPAPKPVAKPAATRRKTRGRR